MALGSRFVRKEMDLGGEGSEDLSGGAGREIVGEESGDKALPHLVGVGVGRDAGRRAGPEWSAAHARVGFAIAAYLVTGGEVRSAALRLSGRNKELTCTLCAGVWPSASGQLVPPPRERS